MLECLGRIGPASLAQVAKEAGCTRTAAFRLLRTMAARGFVIQDGPRGAWRLGGRISALREAAMLQGALAATAAPRLAELARETEEVVYLLVRVGLEAEIQAVHQGKAGLRPLAGMGHRRPLNAGGGRLLLAMAPDVVQTQVLSQPIPRFMPLTVTDPQRVAADLTRVRSRGWLITEGESVTGTVAIGAAIYDASGQVPASVTIFAPSLRMRGGRARELLPFVQRAAEDISRLLGWHGPPAPPAKGPPGTLARRR